LVIDDDQIIVAMRMIWERMKLLIEPSAAVGLAALLSGHFDAYESHRRIGIVLTGGNMDLTTLPWLAP
jgi:threonine dehydratase